MNFNWIGAGVAALSLLATSFSAEAADIPRPYYKAQPRAVVAYYNWTGFYAGINGGYGWGDGSLDVPALSFKPDGWLIGGTLGYNYQVGSLVFGVEGDWDWSDVRGSAACGIFQCNLRNDWLATFRGRLGYAVDRWMPYFTGGLAYGRVKFSTNIPGFVSVSDDRLGWTIGGGLEYAFAGNWSAKIEYLYVDLGKFDCSASCGGPTPNNVDFRENIVRAGLNYKFSGPIFSRY